MALKERKVVLVSKDAEGNTCMDMPLTTVDQVEGAVQSVNGEAPDENGNVAITIPEQVNADWNATEGAAKILNKPDLAAVATSGNYNDLTGKPTITAPKVYRGWVNKSASFTANRDGFLIVQGGSAPTLNINGVRRSNAYGYRGQDADTACAPVMSGDKVVCTGGAHYYFMEIY